jgi:hypothetical protein
MWTTVLPIVEGEDVRSFAEREALVNSLSPTKHARQDGGKWTTPAWGLPTGLGRFAARYGKYLQLPTGQDWMREHTLAPYYQATLPTNRQAAFEARLLEYRPGPRRPLLAIATAEWFVPTAVLCPACDEEHLETLGHSLVLRQWLLPFATRCAVHGDKLRQFPAWTPADRHVGLQPQLRPFRKPQGMALAEAGQSVLSAQANLLEELGQLLQSRGFVTPRGRIRRKELCAALKAHATGRYEHPQLDALLSTEASLARVLAPLWSSRSCLHPTVAQAVLHALREAKEVSQQQLWPSLQSGPREALVLALESCDTLTQAAKQAGVSVTTAAIEAKALGLQFSSKPKKLRDNLRARIEELLKRGLANHEVSRLGGVSIASVCRLLRANPALRAAVEDWRHLHKVQAKRARWLELLETNPASSRTELRTLAPDVYAYLHRCDRQWLSQNQPEKMGRPASRLPRAARLPPNSSEELKLRLRAAAVPDPMGLPPRRTPTRLLRAAGRGMSAPDRQSAEVSQALGDVTESLQDYVHRRLSAAVARLHNAHEPLGVLAVERASGLRPETIRRSGVSVEAVMAATRSFNLRRSA